MSKIKSANRKHNPRKGKTREEYKAYKREIGRKARAESLFVNGYTKIDPISGEEYLGYWNARIEREAKTGG